MITETVVQVPWVERRWLAHERLVSYIRSSIDQTDPFLSDALENLAYITARQVWVGARRSQREARLLRQRGNHDLSNLR